MRWISSLCERPGPDGLWLSLSYLWDRAKASNGGYRIHATRPKARRDTDGCLLDAHGHRVLRKDGSPVRDWSYKRAVLDGEERHPQADLLQRWEREGRVVIEVKGYGQQARWRVLEPYPINPIPCDKLA